MGKCISKKPKEEFFNKPNSTDLKPTPNNQNDAKKT